MREGTLRFFKEDMEEKKMLRILGQALNETHAPMVNRKEISTTSTENQHLPPACSLPEISPSISSFF